MEGQAVKDAPRVKFVDGELTGLRPVLAEDLDALVHLLNESPMPFGDNVPWTVSRLKKKFEDEKDPGLWTEDKRWYTVLDLADGSVVGLLKEESRGGEVWLSQYFAEALSNREALFLDGLGAYVHFKDRFANVSRINVELVDAQADDAAWFAELGFVHQARVPGVCFYLGERRDLLLYSWIPQWVLDRRAPDSGAKE
jgi:hypothetical protein